MDRDLLAEAAARFARAAEFCRGWRFIMEIEEERWRVCHRYGRLHRTLQSG